tara:strand:- start:827 stop:988 length:162 start_codon:yes stop_codon:yes gene_type:complete
MTEQMLKVSTIQRARLRGLKTIHPTSGKIITVHYSGMMVYWSKRSFVYIFVER